VAADMNRLLVSGLALRRGGRCLIDGLDFHLDAGRIAVVLGPNGAGKSSLLLALAGMLEVDTGEISLEGRPLVAYSRKALASVIAWQGSMPPGEFGLTVEQRLRLAMDAAMDSPEAEAERIAACRSLDLLSLRHRPLGVLSSGERQRVELAAMLVRDCPVWLLDEPCTHLDIRHQAAWLGLMRARADEGKAVLAVLHDVQQAAAVADDVILIYGDGRVQTGPADSLLKPEILGGLFQARLLQPDAHVLVPDYRGGEAAGQLRE